MGKTMLFAGCILAFSIPSGVVAAPYHFFSDSTRRDADSIERDQVVRRGANGCTAYFIENKAGKTYLGCARHCFQMSATNWCKNDGYFTDNDGNKGKCVKVVAADTTHDIAVLEADFGYAPRQTLRLSAKDPAVGTRLKMIGYPCDKFRTCSLTVTENCEILKLGLSSPHGGSMNDKSGLHDCTTYGGNSGGPMVAEGTSTVVGLPFTYLPGDYTAYPSKSAKSGASIALMSDFVSVHRAELDAAQAVIED